MYAACSRWPCRSTTADRKLLQCVHAALSERLLGFFPAGLTTPIGEVRKYLAVSLLLLSLLLLCGDISSNPGPRYPCCVCAQQVSYSNKYSFQCNKSRRWVHEKFSGGQTARDFNRSWICPSTEHIKNPVTVPERAPEKLRVLQWNFNGIGNKWSELTVDVLPKITKAKLLLFRCLICFNKKDGT